MTRDRGAATVLLALLVVHAVGKLPAGLLYEMLWACHLATLALIAGLVARQPLLVATGFLFHLGIGLPGWAVDAMAAQSTTWTSAALHVGSVVAGWLAVRERGQLPSGALAATWFFYLATQGMGLLAPAAWNLNVAREPWPFLPWSIGPGANRAVNAAGALLFLIGAVALVRVALRRSELVVGLSTERPNGN